MNIWCIRQRSIPTRVVYGFETSCIEWQNLWDHSTPNESEMSQIVACTKQIFAKQSNLETAAAGHPW
jgi:hypothetical protein